MVGNEAIVVEKNDSLLVDGSKSHSIWNNADQNTVVIKLSLERKSG